MNKLYAGTYYIDVYERFIRADGEPSYYTMMYGSGHVKLRLHEDWGRVASKTYLKQRIDNILRASIPAIDSFNCSETTYGWEYDRYVKHLDDEYSGINLEIVGKGEHTDHEHYTVDISYIYEDSNVMSKLK